MIVHGYAAIFNVKDHGRDIILPGAFTKTLADRIERKSVTGLAIPLFWQHNPNHRIGWVNDAYEDETGLRVKASIDEPDGGAAMAIKNGRVAGFSFGYRARKFNRTVSGRILSEIELFEVSLVTHPMQSRALIDLVEN